MNEYAFADELAFAEQNTRDRSAEEKEELLSYTEEIEQQELSVKILLLVFAFLLFILFLFVPKIYLRSEIYYLSRQIDDLNIQKNSLVEENKALRKKLEDSKFNFLTTEIPIDLE